MPTHLHARSRCVLLVSLVLSLAVPGPASSEPAGLSQYGVFYNGYEPSFYTGFAPRSEDPHRLHLHVGRGNQLRMTLVLSDAVIAEYGRNLLTRYRTYRRLIDQGKVKLTQNASFERFERVIRALDLGEQIDREAELSPEALRERNLELMERLNPGRVFRIKVPVNALIRNWAAEVTAADRKSMSEDRRLELINLLLPTRLWVTKLQPADAKALDELVALPPPDKGEPPVGELRRRFLGLLERVSHGIYPVVGDHLEFAEFTAIHPVGTFNSYVTYKGHKIPQYPTPGRRALTYHQRTRTVDHISEALSFSYLPWLPYMHVGKRLHNSFHTLWWRMDPGKTAFLPEKIKYGDRASRNGKPYKHLWLLSRGPMSHGCTHINAGHMLELRELLPAEPKVMEDVEVFINKSPLFDVFDIDGDLEPEVMGVRYFVAYSLNKKKPYKLRAPTQRRAFYDWLYGGELRYRADGSGWFDGVQDGRFIGRRAVNGRTYGAIKLYEAAYEPEKIQFYQMVDIPFARALRKVKAGKEFSFGDRARVR
jgi:hypothetical protein